MDQTKGGLCERCWVALADVSSSRSFTTQRLTIDIFAEESDIPEMSVEHHLLDKLKPRLQLAKQVDKQQHQIKKANHERNWLKATAEAMDIELDSDIASR